MQWEDERGFGIVLRSVSFLLVCVSVCVCVCVRERSGEKERDRGREREEVCVCTCVCVENMCWYVLSRGGGVTSGCVTVVLVCMW